MDTLTAEDIESRRNHMLRTAMYRLNYNEDDAEDVVQQAMIAAWQKRACFRGGNPCYWLDQFVRYRCMDLLRARSHERTISYDDLEFGQHPASTMQLAPLLVEQLLSQLSARQRFVLESLFIEGLTQEELALSMGIGQAGVSFIKVHALRKLREELKQ